MKALSVQQPFAFEIMSGIKTIEVRSWDTLHRGELLVCSSKKPAFSQDEMEEIEDEYGCAFLYGQALCLVRLSDVRPMRKGDEEQALVEKVDPDAYAWVLENARPVVPFPVKAQQGIFQVDDSLITVSPFKYHQSVIVKKGVVAKDFGIDFSGWQGRTGFIVLTDEGEVRVHVMWDSVSLGKIPLTTIETCEGEGFDWTGVLLRLSEVEEVDARDTLQDVEDALEAILEDNPHLFGQESDEESPNEESKDSANREPS